MEDTPEDFDAEGAVVRYREAVARLQEAANDAERGEWQTIVKRLRQQWKAWSGDDDLHECAFGEPED